MSVRAKLNASLKKSSGLWNYVGSVRKLCRRLWLEWLCLGWQSVTQHSERKVLFLFRMWHSKSLSTEWDGWCHNYTYSYSIYLSNISIVEDIVQLWLLFSQIEHSEHAVTLKTKETVTSIWHADRCCRYQAFMLCSPWAKSEKKKIHINEKLAKSVVKSN